jgi:hypothetical protein
MIPSLPLSAVGIDRVAEASVFVDRQPLSKKEIVSKLHSIKFTQTDCHFARAT